MRADIQVAMYRIAQEALHNVAKHARARQASVGLVCTPGPDGKASRVELCIEDDGIGFDPERVPANQFGLSIMRERAAAIGATLGIHSHPGAGTQVTAVWQAQTQS
jgi:signal transduction histidine kinase